MVGCWSEASVGHNELVNTACRGEAICQPAGAVSEDVNIVSGKTVAMVSFVAVGIFSSLFGVMGVCTNSIHLAVYIRQGVTDGASVSLTALAVSDMGVSILTVFIGLCFALDYLQVHAERVDWMHVMEMAFAWPRGMTMAISASITVFVSAERALCVVWPLKVGAVVTKKRRIVVVIIIYIAMVVVYSPIFFTAGISWQTIQTLDSNTTRSISKLQMWRAPRRNTIEIGVNIYEVIYHFIYYGLTITFSIIMAKGLYNASRFRGKSITVLTSGTNKTVDPTTREDRTDGKDKDPTLSTRDKRAISMVSAVTMMYIVCTFPIMLGFIWRFADPDVITGGSQENLLWLLFTFVYLAESICASCNMFIYLTISTRYRQTFFTMFSCNEDAQI